MVDKDLMKKLDKYVWLMIPTSILIIYNLYSDLRETNYTKVAVPNLISLLFALLFTALYAFIKLAETKRKRETFFAILCLFLIGIIGGTFLIFKIMYFAFVVKLVLGGVLIALMLWMLYKFLFINSLELNLGNFLVYYFIVYIAIGFFFAILYYYSGELFYIEKVDVKLEPLNSIYFSFTTLATTGYGDIHPLYPLTKTLTIFENILGHFLTVFIAGIIISRKVK